MDNPTISPTDWQLSVYYSWSLDILDMPLNKRKYHTSCYIYAFEKKIGIKRQSKE